MTFLCILLSFLIVVPGNIDLDNRQIVINEDGSVSTELSFSVEIDGLEVLIPTVINGEIVSQEEAIQHFLKTGEHLGMFSTTKEAEVYAYILHLRQQERYRRK